MHEAALMAELMRGIEAVARAEGARRVTGVSVWVGALSHMSESRLRADFARAAAGGPAEGARLEVVVSDRIDHPRAQDLVLEQVEVES
jgi:hydrogenase nickel incorporation protein HypA/HybF